MRMFETDVIIVETLQDIIKNYYACSEAEFRQELRPLFEARGDPDQALEILQKEIGLFDILDYALNPPGENGDYYYLLEAENDYYIVRELECAPKPKV